METTTQYKRMVEPAFRLQYSKEELEGEWKKYIFDFISKEKQLLAREGVDEHHNFMGKGFFTKADLEELCTLPFLKKEVFIGFLASLPEEVNQVFQALIWEPKLHQTDLKEKLGIDICSETQLSSYKTDTRLAVKRPYRIFKIVDHSEESKSSYNKDHSFSLFLPESIRAAAAKLVDLPPSAIIRPANEIEKTEYVYTSGERDIAIELKQLVHYVHQGEINLTAKGRPALSSFNKMQRKLNLKEFFPNNKTKELKNMRSALLASLIVTVRKKDSAEEIGDLVKKLINKYYATFYESGASLLYFIKGIASASSTDMKEVEESFVGMLYKLPLGKWVSYENIYDYLRYNFLPIAPLNYSFAASKLHHVHREYVPSPFSNPMFIGGHHSTVNHKKQFILERNYTQFILEPFVKGTLFLFSAFGLLDVAFNKPNTKELGETYYSPYDGLRYVRLTKLGAYVTKQDASYSAPDVSLKASISLSPENLMITTNENDDIAAVFLNSFSEKIGPNRYRTDYSIFLKDCETKHELRNKIAFFKQTMEENIPSNWKIFMKELEQKIDPLETVEEVTIFKIPESNKSLIHIIARDAVLRELTIKAEGYHILVSKENNESFKKRLQDFGYLMS